MNNEMYLLIETMFGHLKYPSTQIIDHPWSMTHIDYLILSSISLTSNIHDWQYIYNIYYIILYYIYIILYIYITYLYHLFTYIAIYM